ncbi:hypothetical protein RJT34_33155 [Clitoria ternatea]|uniref:AP2/ERF domain-containing protein n=1 Tax=Clitoria ternatea TaxID=43366 RepID=A0AAN9EZD6_CLITE
MDILVSFDPSNNVHKPQYFCSSPETSSSNRSITAKSDEEVLTLASTRPKKRAGRRIFKETRHPVYRGVRRRNNNMWVCEVRVPKDKSARIWLGTYPTPEMAARAHDVAALAVRGKSACLNFADSAWRLPLPASTNAMEIRRAAAEAAQTFAVEEDSYARHGKVSADTDFEVCSSSDMSISDHRNKNSAALAFSVDEDTYKPQGNDLLGVCSNDVSISDDANENGFEGLYLGEVAGVSGFKDVHDWLRSMAEEPLRSPSPFVRYRRDIWNFLEDDAEVSLWSFD